LTLFGPAFRAAVYDDRIGGTLRGAAVFFGDCSGIAEIFHASAAKSR